MSWSRLTVLGFGAMFDSLLVDEGRGDVGHGLVDTEEDIPSWMRMFVDGQTRTVDETE